MKVSYCALGCKVNLYEAEAIINEFIDNGYEHGEFDEICDVYIINTCTVTSTSDSKSKKIVRQAVKRNHKRLFIRVGIVGFCRAYPNLAVISVDNSF